MKTRSTFRRRRGSESNHAAIAYRDLIHRVTPSVRKANLARFEAAREIGRNAPKNLPGETNRQLAARLRAEAEHASEAPAKPKRTRTKKVAA